MAPLERVQVITCTRLENLSCFVCIQDTSFNGFESYAINYQFAKQNGLVRGLEPMRKVNGTFEKQASCYRLCRINQKHCRSLHNVDI